MTMKKQYGYVAAEEGIFKTYEEALAAAKEKTLGGGGGLFGGGGPEPVLVVKVLAKVDPPSVEHATVTEIK